MQIDDVPSGEQMIDCIAYLLRSVWGRKTETYPGRLEQQSRRDGARQVS